MLFLDEPTTGFDPAARRAAWDVIRSLRELGKTILLTTHYLDEAESLADRVAVLREGRIVGDRPSRGPDRIRAGDRDPLSPRRRGRGRLDPRADPRAARADRGALAEGRELENLSVRRPTLEEIYLALTGDKEPARDALFAHQLRGEQRLYWRSRELAFFTFLFPLLIFVLLGSVYGDDMIKKEHGVKASAYLLAGILGYGVVSTAFAGLAIVLALRRESGVLKRVRGTPLPPATYLGAVIAST